MKPDWDKLMEQTKGSSTSLIADVDCTAEGSKDLCETHGVEGFPTIKYGEPSELKAYEGGRDFDSLKKFADENLGPNCGPDFIDLCSAKDKERIGKYEAMSKDDLEKKIAKITETVTVDIPLMNKVIGHLKKNA